MSQVKVTRATRTPPTSNKSLRARIGSFDNKKDPYVLDIFKEYMNRVEILIPKEGIVRECFNTLDEEKQYDRFELLFEIRTYPLYAEQIKQRKRIESYKRRNREIQKERLRLHRQLQEQAAIQAVENAKRPILSSMRRQLSNIRKAINRRLL